MLFYVAVLGHINISPHHSVCACAQAHGQDHGAETQLTRFGGKYLCRLNHFIGPLQYFYKHGKR